MKQTDVFTVLEPKEAAQVHEHASTNGKRPYSAVTKALLAGNTIFLANRTSYNTKTFTGKGKRVRTSRGERDGQPGVYIWLDDVAPVEEAF